MSNRSPLGTLVGHASLVAAVTALVAFATAGCSTDTDALSLDDIQSSSAVSGGVTISPHATDTLCVDVDTNQPTNGLPVQVWNCNGVAGQSWSFDGTSLHVYGNKCLDVIGGKDFNGNGLQIWDCGGANANQAWVKVGNVYQWKNHSRCLDLTDGQAVRGKHLQIWDCGDFANPNQQWISGGSSASSGATGTTTGTGTSGNASGGSSTSSGGATTTGGGTATTPPATQPTSTPTTTDPPASQPAAPATASCKRGMAIDKPTENAGDATAIKKTGAGWWYDWTEQPQNGIGQAFDNAGLEYVPMIRSSLLRGNFNEQAYINSIPASAKYILGFNEPNYTCQDNLTPEQAAGYWPTIERIAKARNLKIVSPALNYCGDSSGCHCIETDPFVWLQKFFAACPTCVIDYIGLHWYDCNKGSLKSIVQKYESFSQSLPSATARKLWLTEFACGYSNGVPEQDHANQMADVLPFLDGDSNVFRYSWFMARSTPSDTRDLLGPPGAQEPSALGKTYRSTDQANACY